MCSMIKDVVNVILLSIIVILTFYYYCVLFFKKININWPGRIIIIAFCSVSRSESCFAEMQYK